LVTASYTPGEARTEYFGFVHAIEERINSFERAAPAQFRAFGEPAFQRLLPEDDVSA